MHLHKIDLQLIFLFLDTFGSHVAFLQGCSAAQQSGLATCC